MTDIATRKANLKTPSLMCCPLVYSATYMGANLFVYTHFFSSCFKYFGRPCCTFTSQAHPAMALGSLSLRDHGSSIGAWEPTAI